MKISWSGASHLEPFLVAIEELVPFPENPSVEDHVPDIAKSLRRWGQVRPILTWGNAPEHGLPAHTIVGGHHVWRAAQLREWTHVAAIPATFESYQEALAYLAADNLLTQRTGRHLLDQLSLLEEVEDKTGTGWDNPERQAAYWALAEHSRELVSTEDIKPHPKAVRKDPDEVIEHIAQSLREVGWEGEQVILAKDGTCLAGEEVLQAAASLGLTRIPAKRLDIEPDSPEALRVMAKSYGLGKRAMVDDRAFAELLQNIQEEMGSLEGTGYDTEMLGALLLATRTAAEVRDAQQATEWVGLAEYERVPLPSKLTISFDSEEARSLFLTERLPEAEIRGKYLANISLWWPPREKEDRHALRFVGKKPSDVAA